MNETSAKKKRSIIPLVLFALVIIAVVVAVLMAKSCPPIPIPADQPQSDQPQVENKEPAHPVAPSVEMPSPSNPQGVGQ